MTQRKWQEMTDEEFAEWFRNLKLKALEESRIRAANEGKEAKRIAQGVDPNSPLAIWRKAQLQHHIRRRLQPSSQSLRSVQPHQAAPSRPRFSEIKNSDAEERIHETGINWAALIAISFLIFAWWEISKLFR
jgi:hypothetical protein